MAIKINNTTVIDDTLNVTNVVNGTFSGNVSASSLSGTAATGSGASGTWGINITGSAPTLTTGRTIGMTGDVTWTSGVFNGSSNVTGTSTLANSGVTAGAYGGNNSIPTITVDAKGRVTLASTTTPSGVWGISISGNAATATSAGSATTAGTANTLATARNINGTSFNGSADITTTNWGTARSITIGNTARSVNGSANVSWSLVDMGVITSSTGSLIPPVGNSAQRDASPATGYFRFNTSLNKFEGYNGSAWGAIGGGATGGGADEVFIENNQVVTQNYTVPTGRNAMSTGPVTINNGVIVTVSTGSVWALI